MKKFKVNTDNSNLDEEKRDYLFSLLENAENLYTGDSPSGFRSFVMELLNVCSNAVWHFGGVNMQFGESEYYSKEYYSVIIDFEFNYIITKI